VHFNKKVEEHCSRQEGPPYSTVSKYSNFCSRDNGDVDNDN